MLGFYPVWLTTPQSKIGPDRAKRVAAQLEFLTVTQHDFYAATAEFLRKDLGCKQLINASNWRTADSATELDTERWSYSATDVMAVNRYMSSTHIGPDTGWLIDAGDSYLNLSCTRDPASLPINCRQPVGFPFMVTESAWVMPNLYQSEAPLMIAAYASLTGLQGYCWFTSDSRGWDDAIFAWDKTKFYKWHGATPMEVGQFPAAALLYRNGYATRGAAAVHDERALADLWHGTSPILAEEVGYDPNRDASLPSASHVRSTVDPLAFLVGRCEVVLGGDPAKSRTVELAKYVSSATKTVTSITGQEKTDYGRGLFTLDAPMAQGAAGFLGAVGPVALRDVTIACSNPYATVLLVSQDGKPIRTSHRLLLQIGTTCRPSGFKDHAQEIEIDPASHSKAAGFVIDSVGANPWCVEPGQGSIEVRNAVLSKGTILDANGMPSGAAQVQRAAGGLTVTLPASALYVQLSD